MAGHTKLHAVASALWIGRNDAEAAEGQAKRRKSNKSRPPAIESALDGLLGDDESYTETLGRWVRDTLATTTDMRWWADLHAEHFSREPIAHATNGVQQDNSMYNLVCTVARKSRLSLMR